MTRVNSNEQILTNTTTWLELPLVIFNAISTQTLSTCIHSRSINFQMRPHKTWYLHVDKEHDILWHLVIGVTGHVAGVAVRGAVMQKPVPYALSFPYRNKIQSSPRVLFWRYKVDGNSSAVLYRKSTTTLSACIYVGRWTTSFIKFGFCFNGCKWIPMDL